MDSSKNVLSQIYFVHRCKNTNTDQYIFHHSVDFDNSNARLDFLSEIHVKCYSNVLACFTLVNFRGYKRGIQHKTFTCKQKTLNT